MGVNGMSDKSEIFKEFFVTNDINSFRCYINKYFDYYFDEMLIVANFLNDTIKRVDKIVFDKDFDSSGFVMHIEFNYNSYGFRYSLGYLDMRDGANTFCKEVLRALQIVFLDDKFYAQRGKESE